MPLQPEWCALRPGKCDAHVKHTFFDEILPLSVRWRVREMYLRISVSTWSGLGVVGSLVTLLLDQVRYVLALVGLD